jgi:hypothetical protein
MYLAAQPERLAMSVQNPVFPAESTVSISRTRADAVGTIIVDKGEEAANKTNDAKQALLGWWLFLFFFSFLLLFFVSLLLFSSATGPFHSAI